MAKQPAPGQTKTRLTPPLSPEQASQLYECFLYDMLEIGQATAHSIPNLNYFIAYAPATATSYFTQLAPNFGLIAQRGENLGQRLDSVISEQFQAGFDAVVAINSDSPTLPSHLVVEAFSQLHSGEVEAVFGPCEDGGYYLIGLCAPQPRLVRDVQMSTSHVLADTLMIAEELGLRVHLLPSWYDVDTKDELTKLQREIQSGASDVAIHTRRFFSTVTL